MSFRVLEKEEQEREKAKFEKMYPVALRSLKQGRTIPEQRFFVLLCRYANSKQFDAIHFFERQRFSKNQSPEEMERRHLLFLEQIKDWLQGSVEKEKETRSIASHYYYRLCSYEEKELYENAQHYRNQVMRTQRMEQYAHHQLNALLMEADSKEDVISLAVSFGQEVFQKAKSAAIDHVLDGDYTWEEGNQISQDLVQKLDYGLHYLSEERLAQKRREQKIQKEQWNRENLPKAKAMITQFVTGDYWSRNTYCQLEQVDLREFRRYLLLVGEYDLDLFEQYRAKIASDTAQRFRLLRRKARVITRELREGIPLEDGTKRHYELLDYYLVTQIPLPQMMHFMNRSFIMGIHIDDLDRFQRFVSRHSHLPMLSVEKELHPEESDYQKKLETIEFLRKKKIPLYEEVYHQALKRHLAGNLYPKTEEKSKETTPSKKI